jgi:hypothetical protein
LDESRGGTPEGGRAAFSASPHRLVRRLVQQRLSAFRFPFSFVIAFRSPDEAQRNPGSSEKPDHRSRISLRFIRATSFLLPIVMPPAPTAGFI